MRAAHCWTSSSIARLVTRSDHGGVGMGYDQRNDCSEIAGKRVTRILWTNSGTA
jgi:hypothetical protein